LRSSRTRSRGDHARPDGRLSNSRVVAEAAVTLRPIPREAIRAGGTVAAFMAMRRAGLQNPVDPLPRAVDLWATSRRRQSARMPSRATIARILTRLYSVRNHSGGSQCRIQPATCRSRWTASSPGRTRAAISPGPIQPSSQRWVAEAAFPEGAAQEPRLPGRFQVSHLCNKVMTCLGKRTAVCTGDRGETA
jgi:hypothetical protein